MRQPVLAAALAGLALAISTAAQAGSCALRPANYAVHGPAGDPSVSATWLAGGGVRLKAGNDAAKPHAIRIWCRTPPPAGDVEFSFIVRRLDDNPPVDPVRGIFALFIERFVGTGAGLDRSPANWRPEQFRSAEGTVANDDVYRAAGQGYRSSFMNNNPDAARAWQTRLRTYEGSPSSTQINPVSPAPQPGGYWLFNQGESYRVTYRRVGERLTATQTRLSNGVRTVAVFQSSLIGAGGLGVGGFMGWAAEWGRSYEVREEKGVPLVRSLGAKAADRRR